VLRADGVQDGKRMRSFSIVRLGRWVRGRDDVGPSYRRRRAIDVDLGAAHHPSPILHHRVIGAVVVSRRVQVEPERRAA
jgi:hypothetical protein